MSRAGGLQPFQKSQQRQDAGLAACERELLDGVLGERHHENAVEIDQRDVGQRRRQLPGEIELAAAAEAHAVRAIEQDVDVQVLLFLEALEQQVAVAGVDVPVEIPEVVAGRVLAVVGELDPAAELHRPPLREERTAEHALRDQREVFETRQEVGGEQGHGSECQRSASDGRSDAGTSVAAYVDSADWTTFSRFCKSLISRCRPVVTAPM